MKREQARELTRHRGALAGNKRSCLIYYTGGEANFNYEFPPGVEKNLKNVLESQYYIFGPGVYYLALTASDWAFDEFVMCVYSEKFPLGKVEIDLEDRTYEYELSD